MPVIPTIDEVMADPAVSHWLKDALREAMRRDCVDVVNDARLLHTLLKHRCDAILEAHTPKPLPPLFPLRVDARPTATKTAAGRYSSPTLFDG